MSELNVSPSNLNGKLVECGIGEEDSKNGVAWTFNGNEVLELSGHWLDLLGEYRSQLLEPLFTELGEKMRQAIMALENGEEKIDATLKAIAANGGHSAHIPD